MYLINCWIEHPTLKLDRTYSYQTDIEGVTPGVRVLVPFHHQKLVGFVESVERYNTEEEIEEKTGVRCKKILEVIDSSSLLNEELRQLAKWMAKETIAPTISCFKAMLPAKIKPSRKAKQQVMERWVKVGKEIAGLTKKQKEALDWLIQEEEASYRIFREKFKTIPRTLAEKGAISFFEKEKEAILGLTEELENPLKLSPAQSQAMEKILVSEKRGILLHGVTGSGKTEVYLQVAEKMRREGKQILILVPEISLTPQMVERVNRRFGSQVAIYHSGLNDQEKYEQYQLVRKNKVSIVVGTRSAIFMPFVNLGLIILDEEHDSSYKQESTPAYHCRDIALQRAKNWECKVLLGSATPTLDTYARALKGVYELVELSSRIHQELPQVQCIDLKEKFRRGEAGVLTEELRNQIGICLSNKKQVILLLNRRGYHTALKCNHCQEILMCQYCDVGLSYHHQEKKMKCHTCAAEYAIPKFCPSCNQRKGFSGFGVGTQRVEEELERHFPTARIARMDADTIRKKDSHKIILGKFERLEIDILLGTQMIAKGLDYPNVDVVGILNADAGLRRVDYRSVESTFDLIVQASGRSGRSKEQGKVFLQVFDKSHYAIKAALKQDYIGFFHQEMQFRHAGQYPPYTYLVAISFQGDQCEKVKAVAWTCKEKLCGDFKVLGPSELIKIKSKIRYRIIVKGKNLEEMKKQISLVVKELVADYVVSISVNVNPMVLD